MSDPIVGIATAAGEGGIAIVRISGDGAADLFQQVFRPAGKRRPPYESHRLMYGHAVDGAEMIDECMGVVMYAPHTYTREDVCELHTHGGRVAAALVMKALIRLGARPAEAGEFTRRAFMNGRIDLSQAEAVMGVISAQSAAALRAQEAQLEGGPSRFIRQAQEDLTRLLAGLEAHIDYPDEIDEAEALDGLTDGLNALILRLESAVDERSARILREGLRVALCGRPNAGKSSLTNCMVGANRSIVSDVAGTTRDAIDTTVEHDGTRYIIVDTAGLRRKSKIDEDVEYYSFVRAMRAIDRADVALLVIDASIGLTDQDQKVAGYAAERGCAMIIVLNKWDLTDGPEEKAEIRQRIADRMMFVRYAPVIAISALTGKRVDRIWAAIDKAYEAFNQVIPTNRLNTWLGGIREEGHTVRKGKAVLRMKYVTQTGTCPPRLTFFVNRPDLVDDNFERFLENRLRKTFDLEGTPVQLRFKKKD